MAAGADFAEGLSSGLGLYFCSELVGLLRGGQFSRHPERTLQAQLSAGSFWKPGHVLMGEKYPGWGKSCALPGCTQLPSDPA